MSDRHNEAIGFVGLGDQGQPMAVAIAEAGYKLHVWARKPCSLDGLGGTDHVKHDSLKGLGAACGIVGLCVRTDDDMLQVVTGSLLDGLRRGSVIVNHGTGTPQMAVRLTELCAGVEVLDAPVSGGRLEHVRIKRLRLTEQMLAKTIARTGLVLLSAPNPF